MSSKILIIFSVLAGLSTLPLCGQTSAKIGGTVRNAAGAPIPSATVVLRAESQGVKRDTTANAEGAYAFTEVAPGTYQVEASALEFSDYSATVQVGAGQNR